MDVRKKVAFVCDVRARIDNLQHWAWGEGRVAHVRFPSGGYLISQTPESESIPFHTLRRRFICFDFADFLPKLRNSYRDTSSAYSMQLHIAPHFSKFELALVRGWQSEGCAAKEMWKYAPNLCSK